jgi:hypothetical protein
MKSIYRLFITVAVGGLIFFLSCAEEPTASLFNEDYPQNSKPNPVISSIDPPQGTFSGISFITIDGQNFSSNVAENHVFFNGLKGQVQAATTTRLIVKVPVLVSDSILIKVRVNGAFLFADFFPYRLSKAAIAFKSVTEYINAYSVGCDKDENIYFFRVDERDIARIAHPDSALEVYGTAGPPLNCTGMRFGPDGALYHLRNNRSLYRIPAGGGQRELFSNIFSVNVGDLDFDSNGTLFAGGTGGTIFSVDITDMRVFQVADYSGYRISALRVLNNDLYVAANWAGTGDPPSFAEGIWKHSILSDTTLGPRQEMFDWRNQVGEQGPSILTMTFDEDGVLYVGLDKEIAIMMIDLNTNTAEPLYPEILSAPISYMVWGNSKYLYVNYRAADVQDRTILRVELTKNGAPYYGRN